MSVYEMAIKIRLGKLDLKRPLDDFVNAGMRRRQITELPVLAAVVRLRPKNCRRFTKTPSTGS